ncbi:MAG: ankyrin repeat domain-containing protein [bacterium]|nr:ankyrin repeat domain-containing protein [bacterium]
MKFSNKNLLLLNGIVLLILCLHSYSTAIEFNSGLISAAEKGDINTVKQLLDQGADINVKDRNGITALITAVWNSYTEIVKLLLEKGADVNAKDDYGRTVLMKAVEDGNIEIIKLLMDKGADINKKDIDGNTALILAGSFNRLEAVTLLLEKNADINIKNDEGFTAFTWASEGGYIEIVKELLEKGADVNAKTKDGFTPLMFAARESHIEVLKLLLDKKADVNVQAKKTGFTALMLAEENGFNEGVKLLLEKSANVNARDNAGVTALMKAAEKGSTEIVKLLLEKGADVNAKDNSSVTVLIKTTESGSAEIVKLLLEKDADVNVKTKDGGFTALMEAAKKGQIDIVQLLLEKGAHVNTKADNGLATALIYAEKNGNKKIVKLLKEAGAAEASANNPPDLISAAEKNDIKTVKQLLDKGADVNVKDKYGFNVLIKEAGSGHTEIVKLLLEKGAVVNAKTKGGYTALMAAAEQYNNTEILKMLLDKGAIINAKTDKGDNALIYAAREGHTEIVKILLAKGADLHAKDKYGRTVLMEVTDRGYKDILRSLENKGTDMTSDITALVNSEWNNYMQIVEILLDKGLEVNAKTNSGFTALMGAARNSNKEIVKLLLRKGADVNAKDKEGKNVLMSALGREGSRTEIVKLLLDKGADVNDLKKEDFTAFIWASEEGYMEIVKKMLAKGVDVNVKTNDGFTALMKAAEKGRTEIVKLLLEKGADVNTKKDDGLTTALMYAKEHGHENIVKMLKDAGAEETIVNSGPDLTSLKEKGDINKEELVPAKAAVINAKDTEDTNALIIPKVLEEENVDIKVLAEGNNTFAVNLYNRLKIQDGNLFYSPYSISTLLAMVYAGARGNTEKQIAETLSFPFNREQFHPVFAGIMKELGAARGDNKMELRMSNGLWVQKDHVFLKEYLDLNKMYYDAEPYNVDFRNNGEIARLKINKWVEDGTKNKIKHLVPPGMINSNTKFILTNAVYFKAGWLRRFGKNITKDAPFKLPSGKNINVKMMSGYGEYEYGENNNLQILEMPYKDSDISMIVLLPKKYDGLMETEKIINDANIKEWISSLEKKDVNVLLPKFKITSSFNLSQFLILMGMSDAFNLYKADFSGIADFSKMDSTNNLFISEVIHKAFIDVNEEGAVAGAATYADMTEGGISKDAPVFRADRPFIFLIRDNWSGNILFLGRVTDPNVFLEE